MKTAHLSLERVSEILVFNQPDLFLLSNLLLVHFIFMNF